MESVFAFTGWDENPRWGGVEAKPPAQAGRLSGVSSAARVHRLGRNKKHSPKWRVFLRSQVGMRTPGGGRRSVAARPSGAVERSLERCESTPTGT
ncbi:hypothetical protein D3C76_1007020 [compost metagenome]